MKKFRYNILFILVVLIVSQQGFSQSLIRTNPADLADPQALFINPAILPYQNLSFNLGMKVYHVGFLSDNSTGLKYTYNSNSFPNILFNGVGVGLTLQNFNASILNTAGIGISLGYSFIPVFSVGISAHGSNIHYDLGGAEHFNPNDPLFQNGTGQWNVSFGAGLLVRPNEKLSVGMSCNNINRPDLSLQNKGARLPFEFDFGMKYYFNRIFGASLFSHYQDEELTPGILAEANIDNKGLIRSGYVDRCVMFEGFLNVFNGLSVTYRLDYPLYEVNEFSIGSHQLGVTWNMKFNPDYTFNIQASADTVRVVKEYTKISIIKDDFDKVFANLDYIDLQFPEKKTIEDIIVESPISGGMSLDDIGGGLSHNNHLEAYKENFLAIQDYIKSNNKDFTIDIYFPDATTAERAWVIKKYLIDSLAFKEKNIKLHRESNGKSHLNLNESKKDSIQVLLDMSPDRYSNSRYIEISSPTIEKMVPDKIFFHITNTKVSKVAKWRILITNFLNEPVHEIIGIQNISNLVEWDGFKNDGKLMDVGNYYYQFQYSVSGRNTWIPKRPKRNRLVFIKVKSEKAVEITTGAVNDLSMLKEVVIRLKEPIEFQQPNENE